MYFTGIILFFMAVLLLYSAFVTALQTLPRNHRMLYMHAYQSFVWNQAVSMRLKKFGPVVLIGDIVIDRSKLIVVQFRFQNHKYLAFKLHLDSVRCCSNVLVNTFFCHVYTKNDKRCIFYAKII